MRICLVVRALPVHRLGGLEFHTMDLARGLADLGHEVTIVTSRQPQELATGEPIGSAIRICYLPKGSPGDYSVSFFRNVRHVVAGLDAQSRFDIIHAQEFAGLFLGAWPGRLVCTIHGTMFTEVPLDRRHFRMLTLPEKLGALWRYRRRILLHPAFRRMLGHADRLIVDSEFTFRELVRMIPDLRAKLRIVQLGVDERRYSAVTSAPRDATGKPLTVALLGRLQKMKGLPIAVDAAQVLHVRGVEFRILVGGGGRYARKLQRLVDERNVQDCVRLCGRIPPDRVSSFLHGADVFLFPDLTQPAFGLVAVEALLHGLPVVAARSGAIPEVVNEEVGWLYDPWNAGELARLLERLARRPDMIRSKIESCRRQALTFTATRMAQETETVYSTLEGRAERRADCGSIIVP